MPQRKGKPPSLNQTALPVRANPKNDASRALVMALQPPKNAALAPVESAHASSNHPLGASQRPRSVYSHIQHPRGETCGLEVPLEMAYQIDVWIDPVVRPEGNMQVDPGFA